MEYKNERIDNALLIVMRELTAIQKKSINPHFKNSYFDINTLLHEVRPVLIDNGLLLTQPIIKGKVCSIITCTETGEFVQSCLELPTGIDPQKMGSAITYYRRYTLVGLLAIEAEDDDANTATERKSDREVNPNKYENQPISDWLSKDNFETTMRADIQGVRAVINQYNGKSGKGMKKEYRERLTSRLSELIEEQTMANADPFESALPT